MNKEQAIQVIKNILDQAVKAGICPNLETSAAIIQAWNVIMETIKSENK